MSGATLDQPLLALLIEPSDGAAAKTQLLCDFPLRETLLVPEGIEAAKPIGKKSGTEQVQQLESTRSAQNPLQSVGDPSRQAVARA